MPSFIDDGYTFAATFPPADRLPQVQIEYRPLLSAERTRLSRQISRLSTAGCDRRAALSDLVIDIIVARLVSWDLPGTTGQVRPVTRATISRLGQGLFDCIWRAIFRGPGEDEEAADARNLSAGVRLALTHPQIAGRDCQHCQRFAYDELTGRPYQNPPRNGKLIPRPAGNQPPCRIDGVGCPKGNPEHPTDLNERNRQAYRHYLECRAVGSFPDDPIVRRNAALIRAEEDRAETARWTDLRRLLTMRPR